MKYYILFGLLTLFIIFSGCIAFDNYDDFDEKSIKVIEEYENKLQLCDDNDICTIEYLDKNNICKHRSDYTCLKSRDENKLKNDYIEKINNCKLSLQARSLSNTCTNNDLIEKTKCISELSQKVENINCCYNILKDYNSIKNENYKNSLNKCELDYTINLKDPEKCFESSNVKECFVCYLRNNHLNLYTSNICSLLNGDKKYFCSSSLLLDYAYCNKISNSDLKKKCLTEEVNLNNCIYYNLDKLPEKVSGKLPTNAFEMYDNARTKLEYVKRKELNINEIIANYKQGTTYKFAFDDSIDPPKSLGKCTLDLETPNLDFTKKRYSTFYFDYKEYHFVYTIPVYDDLYIYSKELKYQYCYPFDQDEHYKRYLADELNNAVIKRIAEDFNSLKQYGFNDNQVFEIAVKFVQEIPYNYIWEKRNTYPYEVLYLMRGVCLDKVMLLAQILNYLGYETYVASGTVNYTGSLLPHALLAVPCDNSEYIYDNKKMCLIETTHPYLIGENEVDNKLKFLKLNSGKSYFEDSYGPKNAKLLKDYENQMGIQIKEIQRLTALEEWENYNLLVNEYNAVLYETLKLRFKNYQ